MSIDTTRDKLQRFKDWVHGYLDDKGIPADPGGPHSAEGCRIGDRMDHVFATISTLEEENRRLRRLVWAAVHNLAHYEEKAVRSEPGPLSGPVWSRVGHILGLGSTSAIALCKEFDVEPHAG